MRSLTVRLPDALVAEIEAESISRSITKSDVVRDRLLHAGKDRAHESSPLESIQDLVGSIDDLPPDLTRQKKRYLRSTGYGEKRPR